MPDIRSSLTRFLFVSLALLAATSYGCAPKADPDDAVFMRAKNEEARGLGIEAFQRGDLKVSIGKFMEALRIDRSVDDRRGETIDLINIGRVLVELGHTGKARAYLSDAIALGGRLDDGKLLSEAYATLAKADYLADDSRAAMEDIDRSLSMDERFGVVSGAKLNLKGLIYLKANRPSEAKEALKRALEINNAGNNGAEAANSHRALGALLSAEGSLEDAYEHYRLAYETDLKLGQTARIARSLEGMASVLMRQGRKDEAIFAFERSYIVSLNGGRTREAVESLNRIIDAYRASGNNDRADMYVKIRDGVLADKGTEADSLK